MHPRWAAPPQDGTECVRFKKVNTTFAILNLQFRLLLQSRAMVALASRAIRHYLPAWLVRRGNFRYLGSYFPLFIPMAMYQNQASPTMSNLANITRNLVFSNSTACKIICLVFINVALVVLSGCGFSGTALNISAPMVLHGTVMGGNQPVSGAEVQLYAVGMKGVASAAQPLLESPAHTDDSGKFSLSTDHACASSSAPVYVVARGGNPGLAAGRQNAALELTALVGSCSALSSAPIEVNEVTTVGTVWPLAQYMSSPTNVGAALDDAAFSSAIATVPEFIDVTQGISPGTSGPASYFADSSKLYSLADVLAGCVNSPGGSAGDSSPCGVLFSIATFDGGPPPADTMSAAIRIAQNPDNKVDNIFGLVGSGGAFAPTLASPPTDWKLSLRYSVMAPHISLGTGTYTGTQQVAITDQTANSVIHYTIDGTPPTSSSATYTGEISVASYNHHPGDRLVPRIRERRGLFHAHDQ